MNANKKLGLWIAALLGATGLLSSVGAMAADKELLDMLLKNGAIDKKQYDTLLKKEEIKAKDVAHAGNAHVKLTDKGLEIESNDGNFTARVDGRIQVDSQINWKHDVTDPTGANTSNALADGMALRRARLGAEGTFFKDYDYKFEYDFTRGNGTNGGGVTDAFIAWNGLKPFSVTIGQFKEPFSLEEATSNRFLTFIERNMAVNSFSDNPNAYKVGIGTKYATDRWIAAAAIQTEPVGGGWAYNSSINGNGNGNRNNGSGNTGWDVTGRLAGRPWYNSETEFLHVGASGSWRHVNNNYTANGAFSNGGMSFTAALDSNVDRTAVLNTGNLTTARTAATAYKLDHFTRFGAESALVYGPFSVQGEYLQTNLGGRGYNNESLEGAYGYASYFLTGESRKYKAKTAAWDRITPARNFDMAGGWGAWEVAAGYDWLNLSNDVVRGGQAQTAKLAVNWYPNSHVRLMANFIHVLNIDTSAATDAAVTNPSARQQAFNKANPDMIEFRAQLDF